MFEIKTEGLELGIDFTKREIASLVIGGKERVCGRVPLFRFRLRDRIGEAHDFTAYDAGTVVESDDGAVFSDFDLLFDFPGFNNKLSVTVKVTSDGGQILWNIAINLRDDRFFVDRCDFPLINLPQLSANNTNGDGGAVLLPYNEGVLVDDAAAREATDFGYWEPEYPSLGCYSIFPNMVSSQFLAYLWEDSGLYECACDTARAPKQIDFYRENEGVTLVMRLFAGTEFGEPFAPTYPVVWKAVDGSWESAAGEYREWFERNLPAGVKKICENAKLPAWYKESPLVVSYPVRGRHDTDEMNENPLFYPYTNALPVLESIEKATGAKLLVLLMHWEGTAPWAPPYVWPPYGGVENFKKFAEELHRRGDLLGVYCSGFGYTLKSNLWDYSCEEDYKNEGLEDAMCAGPDGEVKISRICRDQRSGYDTCPASEKGRELLTEAYVPVFESGVDYAQILDQNHGGGQYFCYSRNHGHGPGPGAWMTENMDRLQKNWCGKAGNMILGCESAAAEPFIGNLAFNDNRFELNYFFGRPVPLYSFIYHEYIRNFMGNQCCNPFKDSDDTLRYRIGYSFAAGDALTLILSYDGRISSAWGLRDFSVFPDGEKALRFVRNLTAFYKEVAFDFLSCGRMAKPKKMTCGKVVFGTKFIPREFHVLPSIHTSAWETKDGRVAQLFVNPQDTDETVEVEGEAVTVPALGACVRYFNF
ncbi:MAG: hypothetical protein J6V10_09865 [Clostridia bacterium]|nr:hypothetical protein [Clostridia bacterium]